MLTVMRQSGGLFGQLGERIQSGAPMMGGGSAVVPGTSNGTAPGGSGGTSKCRSGTVGNGVGLGSSVMTAFLSSAATSPGHYRPDRPGRSPRPATDGECRRWWG